MAKRRRAGRAGRSAAGLKDGVERSVGGSPPFHLHIAAIWVSIFCATLFAYWPALHGGLVYDDVLHLTRPELQSWHGLWRIWFDVGATQQYYPLLHSAFWIEYRLWGGDVVGYHLTNIILHALSSCLVVVIVRRLSLAGASLAGLIFALHPVCVESVAWISEQKSTLSGVFYLASALAYLHFDQSRRKGQYLLAFGLFVLALLSKTVTATLPAALLVVFWWRRGRLDWRRDILPLVPWFSVAVPAGLFTAWVERVFTGARGADFSLTLVQRFWLAGRVIWFYAAKLVWPANLMLMYPRWKIDPGVWWQSLFPAAVLLLAAGLGLMARRRRGPLAAFLIFAGTLFPVLGFLNVYPFRYSYVADHFQYLASLAIIVPLASGMVWAARRFSLGKAAAMASSAALLLVLAACTWRQSGLYRDAETLFRETAARNPASWAAHDNLGNALARIPGRLPDAIAEFEEAVRIKPDLVEAHANLGNALSQIPGRLPDAIAECETALRLDPDRAEVHADLGSALLRMPGRLPDATRELEEAVRLRPDLAEARNDLGNALLQADRLPEAITQYEAVLRLRPDLAEVHANLANVLANMPGRLADAAAEYESALRINPGLFQAHYNLAAVLSRIPGRLPDAAAEYEAALRINPGLFQVHYNLAAVLSRMPDRLPDAIAEYRAALRLKPGLEPPTRELAERLRTDSERKPRR